ncbi:hypothetical protein D3C73_796040 [compost metagenome]
MPTRCWSPAFLSILASRTNVCPLCNCTLPWAKRAMRIFGPCRSASTATKRPCLAANSRTSRARAMCSCALPWEKFSRTTSTPARINPSIASGLSVAGPSVAIIFVLRIMMFFHSHTGTPGATWSSGDGQHQARRFREKLRDALMMTMTKRRLNSPPADEQRARFVRLLSLDRFSRDDVCGSSRSDPESNSRRRTVDRIPSGCRRH